VKHLNLPLWIGALICTVIIIVMVFPDSLTAKSPYTIQTMRSWTEDGILQFERAPFPPSSTSALGTDDHGRDIWSLIVHGTGLTMALGLLIVTGRFVIGLPLALAAGFGNTLSRSIIKQFGILFSALPALLLSIIILKQDLFVSLDKSQSIVAFVIVLSIVGWAQFGTLVMERTEGILRQPFIRSEIAIGKRPFDIAMQNVIPHLASELVVLFFMEIARALSLIMQLGIFGVFVGNLRIIRSTDQGVISVFNTSFEPEWASMLGTAGSRIHTAPWMIVFPALAFFVSVLGFNLLGEGLRAKLQETGSGFIPALRRTLQFDLRSGWRSATTAGRITALVLIAALLLVAILPTALQGTEYAFAMDDDPGHPVERVLLGTEEASDAAKLIRDRMEQLGIEPLKDAGYFFDYEVPAACIPATHEFVVTSDQGTITPEIGRDFSFVSLGNLDRSGRLYDATRDDLLNIRDYSVFDDRFIVIDKAYYSNPSIEHIVDGITTNSRVRGIVLMARVRENLTDSIADVNDNCFVVLVSRQLAEQLLEARSPVVSLSATIESLGSTGRNILGIFPGNDPAISDEAIFIGLGYNHSEPAGREVALFNLELMKRLCTDLENRRSIIFAFLDGTLRDQHHGIHSVVESFPYNSADIEVYLNLTTIRPGEFDAVTFSSAQAPVTRYFAWTLARLFEEQLTASRIPLRELRTVRRDGAPSFPDRTADNAMFWGSGVATIVVGTETSSDGKYGLSQLGEILLTTIGMNSY
jgi:peptide/nickel transport system permease protein